MTFNAYACNASGTCVTLFSANQTYSNTGNNRQDFAPNQNATRNPTDYFRFYIDTVGGQSNFSITVNGLCNER